MTDLERASDLAKFFDKIGNDPYKAPEARPRLYKEFILEAFASIRAECLSMRVELPSEEQLNKHSGMWAIAKQRDSAVEDFEMGVHWLIANIKLVPISPDISKKWISNDIEFPSEEIHKLREFAEQATRYANEEINPNEGPLCVRCGDEYSCDGGLDPTEVCHNCAQDWFVNCNPEKIKELFDNIKLVPGSGALNWPSESEIEKEAETFAEKQCEYGHGKEMVNNSHFFNSFSRGAKWLRCLMQQAGEGK